MIPVLACSAVAAMLPPTLMGGGAAGVLASVAAIGALHLRPSYGGLAVSTLAAVIPIVVTSDGTPLQALAMTVAATGVYGVVKVAERFWRKPPDATLTGASNSSYLTGAVSGFLVAPDLMTGLLTAAGGVCVVKILRGATREDFQIE